MYIDIIRYKLDEGVTTDQLKAATDVVHESWMRHLNGFIAWHIHELEGGSFMDIVEWKSAEAADEANDKMNDEYEGKDEWVACYDFNSIESEKGNRIHTLRPSA